MENKLFAGTFVVLTRCFSKVCCTCCHVLLLFCLVANLLALPAEASAQVDLDVKYGTELIKGGMKAPDFQLMSPDGKPVRLSDYRGKYIVLDFWASWCPDCLRDIPDVQNMYRKYHARGVEFIGVSFDTNKSAWQAALKRFGISYTQCSELVKMRESKTAADYGIRWIPSMVLVNPDGIVELATVHSYKIEKHLAELFAPGCRAERVISELMVAGSKGLLSTVIRRPKGTEGKKIPLAIMMHGFGGSKNDGLLSLVSDSLLSHGIATLAFDFNGHGSSEGRFEEMTVANEIADAKAVYDYAAGLQDVSKIFFVGHSQGGVVAGMVAGELNDKNVAGVALLAPAAVLRDDAIRGSTLGVTYNPLDPPQVIEMPGGKRLGGRYVRTAFRLPIYETSAKYHGKAIIVHGTADRVVPYTYGERYHQIWKGSQLHIMEYYDHGFSQNPYRVAEIVSEFMTSVLEADGQ